MLSTNKVVLQKIPSVTVIICAKYQLQHMYVIDLIILSVAKNTKHTKLYLATQHCTRLQRVKERIA